MFMYLIFIRQRQLSVPSLRGRLMSTSESWGVNGHTTRCTNPVSVVLRLRLVFGWGLWNGDQCRLVGLKARERTLLFYLLGIWHFVNSILFYFVRFCCIDPACRWSSMPKLLSFLLVAMTMLLFDSKTLVFSLNRKTLSNMYMDQRSRSRRWQ